MLSSSFYDKLDPTYRQEIDKVVNAITKRNDKWNNENESIDNYFVIFSKFCSTYLTPKELWEDYENNLYLNYMDLEPDLTNSNKIITSQTINEILNLSSYHFYYDRFAYMIDLHRITDKRRNISPPKKLPTIEDLCYPHNMLNECMHIYEKNANTALPQKILQTHYKMHSLFNTIESLDENGDDEKWFKAVIEAEDFEFIQQNVEIKLGADLTNKKLWHLYINYLKEHNNVQHLLQIYSKYCRFFVDDTNMKEEYQKAAMEYSPVPVSWKNPFDFEVYEKYEYRRKKSVETVLSNKNQLSCYFTSTNTKSQLFPFHANLMNYIVKTANANVLQKLNFSCSYFYHKYHIPVCYKLKVSPKLQHTNVAEYNQESVELRRISPLKKPFTRIYISTVFSFCKNNINSLSNVIPQIHRCDAKYIYIKNQVLTLNDFKFLVGHGNVVDLEFDTVTVNTTDGVDLKRDPVVKLEEILSWTPKVQYITMKDIAYSSQTAQKLCDLSFTYKIKHFEISSAENVMLEANPLAEFIKRNIASNGNIEIEFIFDDDTERIERIKEAIEKVLIENFKESEKPDFHISQRIFQVL